jgi:hypothetical protein
MLLYGAANRDERHYADPDRFDVMRARSTRPSCLGGRRAHVRRNAPRPARDGSGSGGARRGSGCAHRGHARSRDKPRPFWLCRAALPYRVRLTGAEGDGQNQRYARLRWTSSHRPRSERMPTHSRRSARTAVAVVSASGAQERGRRDAVERPLSLLIARKPPFRYRPRSVSPHCAHVGHSAALARFSKVDTTSDVGKGGAAIAPVSKVKPRRSAWPECAAVTTAKP